MSAWDYETLTEEFIPNIEFNERGGGEFNFLLVEGNMDCRLATRDGLPAIEWSWEGTDEAWSVSGRGWAILKETEPQGTIFFHGGDETEFLAKQVKKKVPKRTP